MKPYYTTPNLRAGLLLSSSERGPLARYEGGTPSLPDKTLLSCT